MTTTVDGVEYAAPAIANIFPGRVIGPGQTYDRVRAVLTPDELFVVGERHDRWGHAVPVTVLRLGYDRARPDANNWIVTTVDGVEWRVERGSGCGCGSPLRSLGSMVLADYPADLD